MRSWCILSVRSLAFFASRDARSDSFRARRLLTALEPSFSSRFATYNSPVASSGAVLLSSSNDHLNAIASLRAIVARATNDLQAVRLSVSEVLERERSEAEQLGASGEISGADPDSTGAADTEQEDTITIDDE